MIYIWHHVIYIAIHGCKGARYAGFPCPTRVHTLVCTRKLAFLARCGIQTVRIWLIPTNRVLKLCKRTATRIIFPHCAQSHRSVLFSLGHAPCNARIPHSTDWRAETRALSCCARYCDTCPGFGTECMCPCTTGPLGKALSPATNILSGRIRYSEGVAQLLLGTSCAKPM